MNLHGNKDSADVIKLRLLRWENYPGLSGLAQCNHKGLYKREAERNFITEREYWGKEE